MTLRIRLPVLRLPVIRSEQRVPELWHAEELLQHGVHIADAAEVPNARKPVLRTARVLRGHAGLFLLVQLQDERVPELLHKLLNQPWVRVRVQDCVEKGVGRVPRVIRVALVHLIRRVRGEIDVARDMPRVGLLGLVEQAISNQHRHNVAALGLVEDVAISLEQRLRQSNYAYQRVVSDD